MLGALLDVMEALHAPDEAVLADVDALFGPYRTPDGFVAYLTRWVAMDHVVAAPRADAPLPLPAGRLRDLVAHGALLARWRGTPYGMRTALELATGVTGFVLDEPPERPFHLVVRVPPAAADRRALVTRIVRGRETGGGHRRGRHRGPARPGPAAHARAGRRRARRRGGDGARGRPGARTRTPRSAREPS
ncbi:phage tail protein [Micromonospora sp. M42]|nr:phage tail protein [Micromonospora sp. M42]